MGAPEGWRPRSRYEISIRVSIKPALGNLRLQEAGAGRLVDLMLATGARIGEILAVRWEDLDLAANRPTLTIRGTLVWVKGKGNFRQE